MSTSPRPKSYVRIDRSGNSLVVAPLFTFASFTEADLVAEWKAVNDQLEGAEIKNVIVDLGEIPYFGSTVLEWMVQMWRRAKAKGGNLATCNCSEVGREILHAARFDTLWNEFASRDEALSSMSANE
ncbi:MAG: STAS domain-containing protein [Pirellulaceae bacterium]|jgi:anti-anti-sigma factor|nr:STAS domain-containing protein [Pirellulaceae bacterium]